MLPPGHPPLDRAAMNAAGSGAPALGAATGGTSASGASSDIAYDPPGAWQRVPNPNPMRKATFKIPKAAGDTDDAELAVSSAAGGVEANVKRWEGQFGPSAKANVQVRRVNALTVHVVEITGSTSPGGSMGAMGMTGGPNATTGAAPVKEHQMLLGAIVEDGDFQYFFKLVGGEKTVQSAKKDFDRMVATLRLERVSIQGPSGTAVPPK